MTKPDESPKGWQTTTLGSLVSFEYGEGLTKNSRNSGGKVPVYGSNGIIGYHTESLTDKPCIIVGRKGAVGRVHMSKVKCWPIDTTYYIEPSSELELGFVYYLLVSLKLDSYDRSTAIPGLNRDDAYAIKIAVPPFSEQKRIVSKLEELYTKLNAGIECLKKSQLLLNRYRQSILKYAFEGKLTKKWRENYVNMTETASAVLEQIKKKKIEDSQNYSESRPKYSQRNLSYEFDYSSDYVDSEYLIPHY